MIIKYSGCDQDGRIVELAFEKNETRGDRDKVTRILRHAKEHNGVHAFWLVHEKDILVRIPETRYIITPKEAIRRVKEILGSSGLRLVEQR